MSSEFWCFPGAHVVYDLSKPSGSRVVSLELRCLNCTVPKYEPVNDQAIYNVLMMDFTIKGGDGFEVIRKNIVRHVQISKFSYLFSICPHYKTFFRV